MHPDEPHVAGAVMRDLLKVSAQLAGDEAVERALASLRDDQAEEMRGLMPSGWCRISTGVAFHEAMARETGADFDDWYARAVSAGLHRTFRGVWKIFVRVISVQIIVKRAAAVYAKAYDRGKLRAESVGPKEYAIILDEWPDVPILELKGVTIGMSTLLEIAGQKDFSVTWDRTPDGARFQVRLS